VYHYIRVRVVEHLHMGLSFNAVSSVLHMM
jgi:hypothetical protein